MGQWVDGWVDGRVDGRMNEKSNSDTDTSANNDNMQWDARFGNYKEQEVLLKFILQV